MGFPFLHPSWNCGSRHPRCETWKLPTMAIIVIRTYESINCCNHLHQVIYLTPDVHPSIILCSGNSNTCFLFKMYKLCWHKKPIVSNMEQLHRTWTALYAAKWTTFYFRLSSSTRPTLQQPLPLSFLKVSCMQLLLAMNSVWNFLNMRRIYRSPVTFSIGWVPLKMASVFIVTNSSIFSACHLASMALSYWVTNSFNMVLECTHPSKYAFMLSLLLVVVMPA